ncbi:putative mRNA 3-end processing factor [Halarchaeum rubridurum]|uniref:MBL fold metallo-hydrolase n=1 Tax=Halarchaeum rubridurum TaxID=489911 RepID=A0A830FLD7_9EURY|nr:MBL fold metallo-hydrolase [Halarchaeum rubridurum]MBP1954249.1 putative mRNA 3-end processing factor [Halarchaeum rubridurum]GGM58504.1 MBL fold metallo-hydrolase [Halarchaeum rubridurum]
MDVQFLGGADAIGRSALLVNDSLLIDYGLDGGTPVRTPPDVEPDAVVVSHAHLDHVGAVPSLLKGGRRPPVHWTPPTRELADLLARDTLKLRAERYDRPFTRAEIGALGEVSNVHGYGESFEAAGHTVTFYDAGHIPGSAHVLVDESGRRSTGDEGDTRLLYTGDFHTADQRLLTGSTARPDADVVVCESTYADVSRGKRAETERRFARALRETVHRGGTVVVPAFAVGRTQEAMLVCDASDIDCYVDGMGVEVARRLRRVDDYLRDSAAYRAAMGNARFVTGGRGQKRRIARQNTVIVTTSGMLTGGPAMTYVPEIRGSPTNLVAFVGHQVAGTPGRDLLERGRATFDGRTLPVAARTEAFDFSAHADRDGLRSFLDDYRDARVFAVHGDATERFAADLRADGYDATAPTAGETHTV